MCQCKLCYLTWIDWTKLDWKLERKVNVGSLVGHSLTHILYYYTYTPLLLFQRQF